MKRINIYLCLLMLSTVAINSSCRKDSDEDLDTETQSSFDNYFSESQVNDLIKEVDAAATEKGLGKIGPAITIDSANAIRTMIIDYGTSTVCEDGKIRSGKINVSWTGGYRTKDSVVTIIPENFYQGGNKIEGTKTIKNRGRNASGNLNFQVTVTNARITRPDGKTRSWNAVREREWISGENTFAWKDDVYLLTGTSNGMNANGLNYSTNITKALRVDLSCEYRITEGVVDLIPLGKRTRVVDYGNGICDNTINVTVGNKTYTIN